MYIQRVPYEELLAGLAEECAELGHAALKLRRALDGTNPTPRTVPECENALLEEIADVNLYITMLDLDYKTISDIMLDKIVRWEDRLKEKGERKANENRKPGETVSPAI